MLLVGGLIGLVNGLAVAALGLSPIVATLAVNGILQGLALLYSGGTPAGFAPPLLRNFMTGQVLGVTPVVPAMALFAVLAVLLLSHTAFGRRVYAVGNSVRARRGWRAYRWGARWSAPMCCRACAPRWPASC